MGEDEFTWEETKSLAEQLVTVDLLEHKYGGKEIEYGATEKGYDEYIDEYRKHLSEIEKAYIEKNEDEKFNQIRHATIKILLKNFSHDDLQRICDMGSVMLNMYFFNKNLLEWLFISGLLHSDNPSVNEMVDIVMKFKGVARTNAFSIVAKTLRKSTSYVRDHYAG